MSQVEKVYYFHILRLATLIISSVNNTVWKWTLDQPKIKSIHGCHLTYVFFLRSSVIAFCTRRSWKFSWCQKSFTSYNCFSIWKFRSWLWRSDPLGLAEKLPFLLRRDVNDIVLLKSNPLCILDAAAFAISGTRTWRTIGRRHNFLPTSAKSVVGSNRCQYERTIKVRSVVWKLWSINYMACF